MRGGPGTYGFYGVGFTPGGEWWGPNSCVYFNCYVNGGSATPGLGVEGGIYCNNSNNVVIAFCAFEGYVAKAIHLAAGTAGCLVLGNRLEHHGEQGNPALPGAHVGVLNEGSGNIFFGDCISAYASGGSVERINDTGFNTTRIEPDSGWMPKISGNILSGKDTRITNQDAYVLGLLAYHMVVSRTVTDKTGFVAANIEGATDRRLALYLDGTAVGAFLTATATSGATIPLSIQLMADVVAKFDRSVVANETRLQIGEGVNLRRVKIGAAGTLPGGETGKRVLYID